MEKQKRWSWVPVAWLVWGALLLGIALHAHWYPWSHTVYDVYSLAARTWWAGGDVYVPKIDYFRYSPVVAIGFTPFAVLPDAWGTPLWKIFNGAMFAFGLWTFARRVLPPSLSREQSAGLFLLVLPNALHSMYNGQANVVMLGAMLLALTGVAADQWNRAAAWMALATLVKGYPLALAMLLGALFPRRFPVRFLAAMGAGLLLPFATRWPSEVMEQYASWIHHLGDSTVIMRERLRSVDHLLQLYRQGLAPHSYLKLEMAAGAVVLGLSLWAKRNGAERRELLTRVYVLFAAWVVLFGPATEGCTYVIIGPAIGWCLIDAFRQPSSWVGRGVLVISLYLMGPAVTDMFGPTVRCFATDHGSQPIGALLFLGYLLGQKRPGRLAAKVSDQPAPGPLRAAA